MRRVFVAGLYSNTDQKSKLIGCLDNMRKGIQTCARLIALGYAPFCPWLDFLYFLVGDYNISESLIKEYTMEYLRVCEVMYVISNRKGSGVNVEIEVAKLIGIPIVYSVGALNDWRLSKR
jgi:hypothetical protein